MEITNNQFLPYFWFNFVDMNYEKNNLLTKELIILLYFSRERRKIGYNFPFSAILLFQYHYDIV